MSKSVSKIEDNKDLAMFDKDFMEEMAADGQAGFDGVGIDDIAIPFLTLLQALSPQVKSGEGKIPGAEEGMIFNTVTQELFGEIKVVPCAYVKSVVEWIPRKQGGGFVKAHSDPAIKDQATLTEIQGKKALVLPNGHELKDTAYHYVLLLKDDASFERAVIGMTSTALKRSRQWMTLQTSMQVSFGGKRFNPPPWAYVYTLKTTMESNSEGTWANWSLGGHAPIQEAIPAWLDGKVDPHEIPAMVREIYEVGKKFHADVTKGEVVAGAPPEESVGDTVDASTVI